MPSAKEMIEDLREAAEKATPGPWAVRPDRFDDWGWVRGPADADGLRPTVAMARAGRYVSELEADRHRRKRTDPYGSNATYIALCSPDNITALLNELAAEKTRAEAAEAKLAQVERETRAKALEEAALLADRCADARARDVIDWADIDRPHTVSEAWEYAKDEAEDIAFRIRALSTTPEPRAEKEEGHG